MTRPYAEVIGDPISHSKSPLIHNFWLARLGIDAEYRACHVRPEELADYFAARRQDPDWRGCNVTIPHKEQVLAYLDEIEPRARKIGAVNTIWRDQGSLLGCNTDVEGVAEAVQDLDLAGSAVVVVGAGGAARSAFAYLEGRGCTSVRVVARSPSKAKRVADAFELPSSIHSFDDPVVTMGAVLLVNATQLGMQGQAQMPGTILQSLVGMADNGVVFDMVYVPQETGLIKAAALGGRKTVGGLTMLVGQARTAFARFFGTVPPREHDAELRKLLTS
jgi:shikimate dehydrogenase